MYRRAYLLGLVCIFGTIGCPVSLAAKPEAQPDVFVLGALHELHKSEESFSFDDLREALLELKADVWVLEVRPDELTARSHTTGPRVPGRDLAAAQADTRGCGRDGARWRRVQVQASACSYSVASATAHC
jgi:hypothetical protein